MRGVGWLLSGSKVLSFEIGQGDHPPSDNVVDKTGQIESSGFDCELWNYQTGFSPDVICHHHSDNPSHSDRSDSDRDLPLIVLSAHYDSRGSFGFTAAPGADDDGSGTAMLLAVSRAVRESGVSFRDARLVVVGFSGEGGYIARVSVGNYGRPVFSHIASPPGIRIRTRSGGIEALRLEVEIRGGGRPTPDPRRHDR